MLQYGCPLLQNSAATEHCFLTKMKMFKDYYIHPYGATSHIARAVTALLCIHFGNDPVMSRSFLTNWSPIIIINKSVISN